MDAVEFIKTYSRMCHYFDNLNGDDANPCTGCPLENIGNGCNMLDIADRADEAVAVTERWAKEHPVKTRQSEFLKMFPLASLDGGSLFICPRTLDPETYKTDAGCIHMRDGVGCRDCRRDFWLQEVE